MFRDTDIVIIDKISLINSLLFAEMCEVVKTIKDCSKFDDDMI